jgi:hypothetical protein
MHLLMTWLMASPDKRVCQLEFTDTGFRAVCVEKQLDGSGKELARCTAVHINDALSCVGKKLPAK